MLGDPFGVQILNHIDNICNVPVTIRLLIFPVHLYCIFFLTN